MSQIQFPEVFRLYVADLLWTHVVIVVSCDLSILIDVMVKVARMH